MNAPSFLAAGRVLPATAADLHRLTAALAACVERSGGRVIAVCIDSAGDARTPPSADGDAIADPRIQTPGKQP